MSPAVSGDHYMLGLPTLKPEAANLKTAMALGLTIPPSILVRADQVIQ